MRNDPFDPNKDDKEAEIEDTTNINISNSMDKSKDLIENMRTNLIKSIEYKISDIKKNVNNIND